MPKKVLSDLRINKVKKPQPRPVVREPILEEPEEEIYQRPSREEPEKPRYKKEKRKGRGKKISLWFLATISVIFLFFAVSFVFSKASITINPKVKDLNLNTNLSAVKDGSGDSLPFKLVVISGEEHQDVPASTEEDVYINSSGKVAFYNKGTGPQLLAAGTKLDGSNGKTYKLNSKVTVPAAKGTTPGKVETTVSATAPGGEYDSKPLDFKIPTFKGTPKYDAIYGRSTSDITGGAKGKFPSVSSAERDIALTALKTTLNDKLLKKATDQIPKDFVLFKDAVILNTEDQKLKSEIGKTEVPVGIKGTLYGILLNEKQLSKKIAEGVVEDYDGSDVYIQNIKNLKFTLANRESISSADLKDISFNLTGKTKLVWRFDEAKFKEGLLGEKKTMFNKLLAKYPNINSADLVIEPFWRSSFPDKPEKIKIIVNYPE
jgi:hypothetical protein